MMLLDLEIMIGKLKLTSAWWCSAEEKLERELTGRFSPSPSVQASASSFKSDLFSAPMTPYNTDFKSWICLCVNMGPLSTLRNDIYIYTYVTYIHTYKLNFYFDH